ncbi:response regulator [Actinoplanes auranticolor]|uniref:DNA-binding response regulator n=1 Tax=Actinoplanes auranticolor TaxID=47988 RepID=A0A919S955_9ACTN|nr:response regulator transcription factor [Actinoplanes auranticolor]GIM65986.1 DNA-binding response regulator [Actinoplanes auranticolor]
MISLALADDQALVRAGFRSIVAGEPDMTVVGEASDGEQAVRLARQFLPQVMLMDIRMPGVDGLAATREICSDGTLAGVKVVILTTFESDAYVYGAIRAGASGFLLKDIEPVELIHAVRVVARGDALLAPSVTRRLIAEMAARLKEPPAPAPESLTPRELEILDLVAAGRSNEEIATVLAISYATVKTHVSRILAKLAVRDRAQLVVWAYESGRAVPGWLP